MHTELITSGTHTYTTLFEEAEEGGFVVTCPKLPGVATGGDTIEEAREMAADAILCIVESLQKDGMPVPIEEEAAVHTV